MKIPQNRFSVQTLLSAITNLPHRGAATAYETKAADLLQGYLADMGAIVRKEPFQTPKTYATIIYWLIGGLLTGLALIPVTGVAVGLVWYFVWLAWLYFNWRYSFIVKFPAQHTAHNVIGHWPARQTEGQPIRKVILIAHYDTAPISWLYSPKQQANFRLYLIISLWLMLLAASLATLEAFKVALPYLTYIRYGLMAFLGGLAFVSTIGYWLNGYANGASDNATGVAAALATADQLQQANRSNLDIEVVLTSAQEVGMIGSYNYVNAHRKKWKRAQTLAVNFDTLGAGTLTVVEQTGTAELIRYDNEPTRLARQLVESEHYRDRAKMGSWHAGDFDSVWFIRNKIPVLALCAQDSDGRMPRIHQPDDTLDSIEMNPVYTAVDLVESVITNWLAENSSGV